LRNGSIFAYIEQMRKRDYLGQFELMVLLAVLQAGDNAYGVPIAQEIEETTRKEVALGSIYAALDRLEAKGLVTSTMGDPTPERGGRAKRYFRVTVKGVREARQAQRTLKKLWTGLPQLEGGKA
jgi:PadR family transcriptional regulator PadR